ncbi:MAG: hypothetical protein ACLRWQ_13065 [Flavonifractor plautii]
MESNLLKLDMLGHDDPTMIRMLQDLTGVDPQKIPLDDPDTMSIFQSSEVLGYEDDKILGPTGATAIPEFGTSFVRGCWMDTQPNRVRYPDPPVRLLPRHRRVAGQRQGPDRHQGTAKVSQAIGCRDDIMLFLISCGMDREARLQDHGGGAEGPGPAGGGGGGDEGSTACLTGTSAPARRSPTCSPRPMRWPM